MTNNYILDTKAFINAMRRMQNELDSSYAICVINPYRTFILKCNIDI